MHAIANVRWKSSFYPELTTELAQDSNNADGCKVSFIDLPPLIMSQEIPKKDEHPNEV